MLNYTYAKSRIPLLPPEANRLAWYQRKFFNPLWSVYFCWVSNKKKDVSHTWQVCKILNKSPFNHQSCPVKPTVIDQPTFCWSNHASDADRLISPGCSKVSWEGVLYPFRKTSNIKYYTRLNNRTPWKQSDPVQWDNLDSWVKPCFPKTKKQNKHSDSFLDKRELLNKFKIILFI